MDDLTLGEVARMTSDNDRRLDQLEDKFSRLLVGVNGVFVRSDVYRLDQERNHQDHKKLEETVTWAARLLIGQFLTMVSGKKLTYK